MTGHSHQAWPDVARDGLLEAFADAAAHVDDKWARAAAAADAVRAAVAARIGGRPEDVALGGSTHELVTRFLSALDWRRRRHVVTTAGEFHSLARQLDRLAEAGVEVTRVPVAPLETLAARLAAAVRDDTAALMASTVLFRTAAVVPGLAGAVAAARAAGAEVLLDAYHAFNVVPFRIADFGADVFVTAGGYKYAQWGEGCCFLHVPAGCSLRPVYTGWFADFAHREARAPGVVGYGDTGAERFAGSTYDPTSHYRARAVARFFDEQGLDVDRLRAISLRQTARLRAALEGAFEVVTPGRDDRRGGFLAVRVDDAPGAVAALRARGIFTDAREGLLRLGPAPYLDDEELDTAAAALVEIAGKPRGSYRETEGP